MHAKRLAGQGGLLTSKANRPTFRHALIVHEGLLNLELYHLEALIKSAADQKFNFYYLQ